MAFDLEARIQARAYQLWLEEGRPEGQALAHWVRAETELAAEGAAAAGTNGLAEPAAPAFEPVERTRKPLRKKSR